MIRKTLVASAVSLAVLPAVASEGGDAGSALITPDFGLIFWTVVSFVLLAFVLGRFAWKPLLGALEQREQAIREDLDSAKRERVKAEELVGQHKQLVAQARREHAEAVAAGQRDAERLKAEILDEGKRQRDELLKQTQAQIAAEMRQAQGELRGLAADLAIRAAEKLMARNMDDSTQRKLVDDYLEELERGPDGSAPTS